MVCEGCFTNISNYWIIDTSLQIKTNICEPVMELKATFQCRRYLSEFSIQSRLEYGMIYGTFLPKRNYPPGNQMHQYSKLVFSICFLNRIYSFDFWNKQRHFCIFLIVLFPCLLQVSHEMFLLLDSITFHMDYALFFAEVTYSAY